jgi:hypothetical protein
MLLVLINCTLRLRISPKVAAFLGMLSIAGAIFLAPSPAFGKKPPPPAPTPRPDATPDRIEVERRRVAGLAAQAQITALEKQIQDVEEEGIARIAQLKEVSDAYNQAIAEKDGLTRVKDDLAHDLARVQLSESVINAQLRSLPKRTEAAQSATSYFDARKAEINARIELAKATRDLCRAQIEMQKAVAADPAIDAKSRGALQTSITQAEKKAIAAQAALTKNIAAVQLKAGELAAKRQAAEQAMADAASSAQTLADALAKDEETKTAPKPAANDVPSETPPTPTASPK